VGDRRLQNTRRHWLGQKTGIDLPAGSQRRHAVGRVEDPQLQAKVVCRRDNFRGIGQGAVAITPVQLMRAIAAISMDGKNGCAARGESGANAPGLMEVGRLEEVKQIPVDVAVGT